MSAKLHTQVKATSIPASSLTPVRAGLLQRKRASGGTPGSTGEFAEPRVRPLVSWPPLIQAKLTVGPPDDRYEREADRVADLVMRMPDPRLQRQVEPEEEEENEQLVQAKLLTGHTKSIVQRQEQETPEEPAEAPAGEIETTGGEATSPTVVNIDIQRDTETDESTLGTLTVDGNSLDVLELPDRDNAATEDSDTAGRIPAGTYQAHIRTDGSRGWRIELEGVPDRTNIQIHVGNTPDDTVGCILPGTGRGENRVNNSTAAMNQIQQIVENAGEGATIQVTVTDPPVAEEESTQAAPVTEPEETQEGMLEPVVQPKHWTGSTRGPRVVPKAESGVVRGAGKPLPPSTRDFFEPRFEQDFSRVRIHTDTRAAQSARALNAYAYTVGHDIVFGAGQYAPEERAGRRLLAHELTHVVQQGRWTTGQRPGLELTAKGDQAEQQARSSALAIERNVELPPLTPQPLQVARDELDAGIPSPSEEVERRAQLECIKRIGGCPQTRPAGIPTAEELKKYNRTCRQETAYTGPDIKPTDDECLTPVSVELLDAPLGATPRGRVKKWLQEYRLRILEAEERFLVDRRAISGAIAWEALENPYSWFGGGFARFRGPGKVHYKEGYVFEGDPAAMQVETAGYLPKQTKGGREKVLSTITGSVAYIGAIMRAFADLAVKAGYYLNCDPPMLTTFYNAWDINEAKALFKRKRAPDKLTPNEMGAWVDKNLSFLESAVGKPSFVLCIPTSAAPLELPGPMSVPEQLPTTVAPWAPSERGRIALSIALGEVGVRESPAGSNRGACPSSATRGCVDAYTGARPQPWCAHFVSWAFGQTGFSPFGHLASVNALRSWGRSMGWYFTRKQVEDGDVQPLPGDIFTKPRYEGVGPQRRLVGGHTGFVVRYDAASQLVETVEGNTGDAVRSRTRDLASLDGFIRVGT